jgi:hypothetical protein
VVLIPPKLSVATYLGCVKGKSALRLFSVFRDLRRRPYWGNHFWSHGYCVGTGGLDEEKSATSGKAGGLQDGRRFKAAELALGERTVLIPTLPSTRWLRLGRSATTAPVLSAPRPAA